MDKHIYRTSERADVSGVYNVYEAGEKTELNWHVKMRVGDIFPPFESRDMWFKLAQKELDTPAVYQDTLVGYFDIHAYSVFLEKVHVNEAVEKIKSLFSNIKQQETDFLAVKIEHWVLSDAIIMVVNMHHHPLFQGSIEVFLATCSFLMAESLREGFPLRGAIGGGYFYKDGEVMVSTGLIDANRFEKKQNWLGAVLTPASLQAIEKARRFEITEKGSSDIDLLSERFQSFVRHGLVPWKPGNENMNDTPHFYLKPRMAQENWGELLPEYFYAPEKVENSRSLYEEP